jgi:hypothetical protein
MVSVDLFPDGILGNDNAIELFAASEVNLTDYLLCGQSGCRPLTGLFRGGDYQVYYQAIDGVSITQQNGNVTLYDTGAVPWLVVDQLTWTNVNDNNCLARVYDTAQAWEQRRLPTIGFGNSSWGTTPTPTVTPTP